MTRISWKRALARWVLEGLRGEVEETAVWKAQIKGEGAGGEGEGEK